MKELISHFTKKPLKKIDSEEEFIRLDKIYRKLFEKHSLRTHRIISNPRKYLNDTLTLIEEMKVLGLISELEAIGLRSKVFKAINTPSQLKREIMSIIRRKFSAKDTIKKVTKLVEES